MTNTPTALTVTPLMTTGVPALGTVAGAGGSDTGPNAGPGDDEPRKRGVVARGSIAAAAAPPAR